MTGESCLVCASDEGLFLDVVEQPTLKAKARNCKISQVFEENLSTKVCHKCAFEIEQCNKFIEKIKKANKIQNSKKACCGLCSETYNKEIFFDLSKQKIGVKKFIQKIQDLFTEELQNKELRKQLICLFCRYCVDLLTDLRNLSDKVFDKLEILRENGNAQIDLPKTNAIINRKTTYLHSNNLDLNTPSDTDSDSSNIMSSRRRVTKTNKSATLTKKLLKCAECKIQFENGMDMYRFYHTGHTVCKKCWISIDPGKMPSKKRKKIDYIDTKLCSVVLKDVLLTNEEKDYRIEKGDNDNKLFIVHVSDTEIRTKRKTSKTTFNHVENEDENNETSNFKKSKTIKMGKNKEDVKETETKSTTNGSKTKQSITEEIQLKPTRISRRRKDSEQSVQDNISPKSTRSRRTRKDSEQSIQEDSSLQPMKSRSRQNSEQSFQEVIEPKTTRASRRRKDSEISFQGESIEKDKKNNKNNKKIEQSEKENEEGKKSKGNRRRKESEQSEFHEDSEINVDADSDGAPISKKVKKINEKIESMSKPSLKTHIENQNISIPYKRGRSSSIDSISSNKRSTRNTRKNNIPDLDEIIEIDDDLESINVPKELTNKDVLQEIQENLSEDVLTFNEHQTDESNASESHLSSTKRTSKFKTPPIKRIDKQSTIKSIEVVATSESEEIDVLKSTDEESKEDLLETEDEKSNVIELNSFKESVDKLNFDDCKSNKNKTDLLNNDILKITEATQNNLDEVNKSNNQESTEKCKTNDSLIVTDGINELKGENSKSLESHNLNEIKDSDEIPKKSIKNDNVKINFDNIELIQNDDVNEIKSAESLDIINEDKSKVDDMCEINAYEDEQENNDNLIPKQEIVVNRRSHIKSSKSRRSRESEKRKSNKSSKNSVDKMTICITSDTEAIKPVEVDETSYTCKICDKIYENKYIGLQHELSHMKTLKILLQKVKVATKNNIITEQESDECSDNESLQPSNCQEEKMIVDVEVHETESKKLSELEISEENCKNEIVNNETQQETKCSIENLCSETTKENEILSNELSEIEEREEINCKVSKNETGKESIATDEKSKPDVETETPKKRRSLARTENKSDRKSRGRRKTNVENNETEKESDTDKIAEAVQETLNDMAELHGKIQSTTAEVSELNEKIVQNSTDDNEKENEIKNTEYVENKENENDVQMKETPKECEIMPTENVPTQNSESIEELITYDSDENNVGSEESTCIVDVDSESSKEVVEIENEIFKQKEESEIEITEVDVAIDESVQVNNDVENEEVETSKNYENETEVGKLPEVVDLEQMESSKSVNGDDDIECVSEINITASETPCLENNDENSRNVKSDPIKTNIDDEDQTTEDEALAQASLEDLLERKEFQVIDELAESVTDGDEESEKEVNVNLSQDVDKANEVEVDNEIEIKISDAECTEILEVDGKSVRKEQTLEENVIDENEIIQDDGVVEEVVQDDDQPQSEVVQEVEVESNGNCLEITTNVREVLTEGLNERDEIEKRLGFQTEPISDDETDLMPETLENISKEIRNSQDMPSLDPIGEGIDDE